MDASEKLYYSLGKLCYVMACADGEVQSEEIDKLEDIVKEKIESGHLDGAYTEIIFKVLESKDQDPKTAYDIAMKNFENLSYYFTDDLKTRFLRVLREMAEAFPPNTTDEASLYYKIKTKFDALSNE